jgi:hypothetical protein
VEKGCLLTIKIVKDIDPGASASAKINRLKTPSPTGLLAGVIGLSTGTRPWRRWLGGNQVGTLLIRIRAAVALDVQSDLNSQAAGVGSTSRPISEPRLSRKSCSLCDLGGSRLSGASPARHVCDQVGTLLIVRRSNPAVRASGLLPSDEQSAFASSSRWVGTLLIGVGRWRTAAGLARSRVAILSADPGGSESPTEQVGTLLTRSGDSTDSTASLRIAVIQ